jgi:hypothetical protein
MTKITKKATKIAKKANAKIATKANAKKASAKASAYGSQVPSISSAEYEEAKKLLRECQPAYNAVSRFMSLPCVE